MNVSNIKVKKVNNNKIKGAADIVIDNAIAIHNIRIFYSEAKQKYYLSFPSRRFKDGAFKDVCHPILPEARDEITKKVLEEFEKIL